MACFNTAELCFVAGDTVSIAWEYKEDNGTAIDLTGATASMQLLDNITDAVQVDDMTGGITDHVNGSGIFSLTNVESQALLPIGNTEASKVFTSVIKLTFADTTTKTIAGFNVTIQQGGIR